MATQKKRTLKAQHNGVNRKEETKMTIDFVEDFASKQNVVTVAYNPIRGETCN